MSEQQERLTLADRLTWSNSDPVGDDRRWRATQFYNVPLLFQKPVAETYNTLYAKKGRREANSYLRRTVRHFHEVNTQLATDDDHATEYTKRRAADASRVANKSEDPETQYKLLCKLTKSMKLNPPKPSKDVSLNGAIQRMQSERWIKQQLVRYHLQKFESAAIRAGMVHRFEGMYVSNEALAAFQKRNARHRRILNSIELENELGYRASLSDLAATSVSNPANRRHELMARLYGFDQIAKEIGHCGLFVTLTCPSRMHARYSKSGDPNPKYDGTSPSMAQKYLCKLWANIRSKLKHGDINIYGFRVVEPQHDATPHWHILLYTERTHEALIKDIFTEQALRDSPEEKGADKRRCVFMDIDWEKGSGVGYIAKYISKNIDGTHIDQDLNGMDAQSSIVRVAAWASIHRIRQFQQFGGPAVGCWRELRRANAVTDGLLEQARSAADNGDWQTFTTAQGGTEAKRKDQPIKPLMEYQDELGQYGDPKGYRVAGVTDGNQSLFTRLHHWTIKSESEGSCGADAVSRAGTFAHLEFCQ